jgi:DNA repair exonuclease SbcCD ATPase subunit
MKLHLVNFRCYSDKIFEFGDDGLILITACSGSGKSTILMAIQFALFGTGTKVSSYGKTSCKVELEFDDMKIVRTKRPNRLILNDEYEDSVAQEIINKKFGDTFDVTGYISQNALNSFIIMSPTDKLEFLEKFAFKNINLAEIKNRCKTLISKRNDELNKTVTQLETNISIFKELKKPTEVKFPLEGKKSQYEKLSKNEEIRKKNCEILIKKARTSIEKNQNELSDLRVFKATLDSKRENIVSLDNKIQELEKLLLNQNKA